MSKIKATPKVAEAPKAIKVRNRLEKIRGFRRAPTGFSSSAYSDNQFLEGVVPVSSLSQVKRALQQLGFVEGKLRKAREKGRVVATDTLWTHPLSKITDVQLVTDADYPGKGLIQVVIRGEKKAKYLALNPWD